MLSLTPLCGIFDETSRVTAIWSDLWSRVSQEKAVFLYRAAEAIFLHLKRKRSGERNGYLHVSEVWRDGRREEGDGHT